MSQEVGQTELKAKTQQLLDGPLKHIRAAAIAAALLPLASVAATPASAQSTSCASGGLCGFVFNDVNGNGIQDEGDLPIEGATVSIVVGSDTLTTDTGPDGFYYFGVPAGTYTVGVKIPAGMEPSPSNAGSDDTLDSDGVGDTFGHSVATVTFVSDANSDTDFGFVTSTAPNPGTGTPGYWKNHPDAWPVSSITVGGVTFSIDDAIAALGKITKDKTTTMFSSLVSAKLNLLIGNSGSCVSGAIAAGDAWMAAHHLGSVVLASSDAWKIGEPTHKTLDAYNNGLLCVQHRQ
jgi:hypothetical protein